jgi:hypothetical protein
MEQQLNAAYLSPGPIERAAAIGISAIAIGIGVLLAAWGISLLWRYTPPEIAIRIANPEVSVTQNRPLIVEQDGPFTIQPPGPLKIDPAELTIKTEQSPAGSTKGPDGETKTATGDVIKREVTVFWSVSHGSGQVVTGWSYPDGRGGVPVVEYCYYDAAQMDGSFKRINIARNRIPSNVTGLMPDLQAALAKCQWWQA